MAKFNYSVHKKYISSETIFFFIQNDKLSQEAVFTTDKRLQCIHMIYKAISTFGF